MRKLKTDKVMDLLGKSSPKAAEEEISNPALKIPEEDYVPVIYTRSGSGTQLVNVMFLLLNEQLGSAAERFHCCTCPACAAAMTAATLKELPSVIVTVKRKADERRVNELAQKYRATVTRVIAKAVISVKSNPPGGHRQLKVDS